MGDFREQFMKHVDATPLPPLGDDRTRLTWEFTETDLNTIAFAVSFVRHALGIVDGLAARRELDRPTSL